MMNENSPIDEKKKVVLNSRRRCSVPGCPSKYDMNLSFFKFPKNQELNKLWKIKCRIRESVKHNLIACEKHFAEKQYFTGINKRRKLHENAVPKLNLPLASHTCVGNMEQNESRMERLLRRTERKNGLNSSSMEDLPKDALNSSMETSDSSILVSNSSMETSYLSEVVPNSLIEPVQFTDVCKRDEEFEEFLARHDNCTALGNDIQCQCNKSSGVLLVTGDKCVQTNTIHDVSMSRMNVMDLLNKKNRLNSWTGIPTFELLHCIEDCVSVGYPEEMKKKNDLTLLERIILCFIKLKTNLSFACMASIFDVANSTISRNFNSTLPMIKEALEGAVYFPTREETKANLPKAFRKYGYHSVRATLDCSEVKIQVPKCMNCRIATYSRYKSSHTFMFMLSITPGGLISNVSRAYSGKASDKMIFNAENLIEKFDAHHDSVMVDKGVMIEKELLQRQIYLVRPSFFNSEIGQFEECEQICNTKIAKLRVHVERALQRMKIFRILTQRMEYNILPQVDNIIFICAAIANLTKPILAEDKF